MSRTGCIVIVVLLALSALLGWQLNRALEKIGGLNARLSDKNGQLIAVNLVARANDSLQLQLQKKNDDLRAATAGRRKHIQEVIREDEKAADWAGKPLPDAVIRLQRRPAVTGAAGYQSFLSQSDALHVDGKQPGQ